MKESLLSTSKVPVSFLVPIKNEASNLPRCLDSIRWAAEVFVVDSQSTDNSAEIALNRGARVVQFHFGGIWPKKKNWALENLPFSHEWVFILDADEVLPASAEEEVRSLISASDRVIAGYWINRRFMFMGKWLQYSYYPNWNLRLFKHRFGRYEKLTESDTASGDNEVHEHVIVDGQTGRMVSEMDHYAFPSVDVFVEKHNRYSNWEARVALDNFLDRSGGLQHQPVGLRRKLKKCSQKLPFRPFLRFFYVYIWQRGFLDGREGYYFARLHGMYELLSVAKTFELKKNSMAATATKKGNLYRVSAVILIIGFSLVLFCTLQPARNGLRGIGIPVELRNWFNYHDDLANFAGFGALACLWLNPVLLESRRIVSVWKSAILLGLIVIMIETTQLGLPGRVADWNDVAAAWGGIMCATALYLISRIFS